MEDYTIVTEVSHQKVTGEQIQRMYTRYRFASDFCQNKDVLEVACGSGQGLGFLALKAKRVVGIDINQKLLTLAEKHYQKNSKIEFSKRMLTILGLKTTVLMLLSSTKLFIIWLTRKNL